MMKASDAFALMLAKHRVGYCFELIGGMLTHLVDSLSEQGIVKVVSMHHEQAAAFAAEGVVRHRQKKSLSVAMGTSGPGATNLVTGISSCWFDSIPCLFITGQVNCSELKGNSQLRQQGFQELDIVSMVDSVTKYAVRIDDVMQLLPLMHHAMSEALLGRCGPVLLDIPNDIQRMDLPDEHVQKWINKPLSKLKVTCAQPSYRQELKQLCAQSKRPLVCLGGGITGVDSFPQWLSRLQCAEIPYVSTLMGQQFIAEHACYYHMIGTYGNREANWAIQNCDLLIVLGARLDVRQTGADMGDFARHARIVQVDIDAAQLCNRVSAHLSIHCSLSDFFHQFPIELNTFSSTKGTWLSQLNVQKESAVHDEYQELVISPYQLITKLNHVMQGQACHYVCDVGNHQMWAAQLIRLGEKQSIHHDGGLGAMGFSLPVAIGIALESGDKTVVLCGDGGIQLNIQEFDTICRMNLNITVIVMNNQSLGMVKNFQDMYFEGRNYSTLTGYSSPCFYDVARAYKMDAASVHHYEDWDVAISKASETKKPFLIEVMMPNATECRPRLAFGSKLDEQFPMLHKQ